MVIYLAGLQGIPDELLEAAEVDGVGPLRRFVGITLPMQSPVILFNVLMAVIGSFQVFTQAFVMTGGEPGDLARFYVLYLFNQGFEFYEMGYAWAMAWVLLAVVLVVTAVLLRSSARFVYYEARCACSMVPSLRCGGRSSSSSRCLVDGGRQPRNTATR
jgi:multiple sugar transport system permease protein